MTTVGDKACSEAQNVVISSYPLSRTFRTGLIKCIKGDLRFLNASQLRGLSIVELIRLLWREPVHTAFVVSESEGRDLFQSILEGLAAVSRARRIRFINREYQVQRRFRVQGVLGMVSFAWASVRGYGTTRSCAREVRRLQRTPDEPQNRGQAKRVLYLKSNLMLGVKAGGSVGHVAGVINGLRAHGYAVDFVGSEHPIGVDPTVSVHLARLPKHFGAPIDVNHFRYHRSVTETARALVAAQKYSFCYQRMSVNNYAGVVIARAAKIPLVLEYNGSEAWVSKHWGIPMRFHDLSVAVEDVILKHASLVVTVSEVLREELLSRKLPESRIVCHPNGVDPQRFDPDLIGRSEVDRIRAAMGIAKDQLVIGFLGTFGAWHGAEVMADAVMRIGKEDPEWFRRNKIMICYIGDGPRLQEVQKRFEDLEGKRLAVFTGLVEQHEAPRYLAACNIVVCPTVPNADGSRFFGSPTKVFEYMAMERCIVASDLEQVGEVLRPAIMDPCYPEKPPSGAEGERSILVTPGDAAALARAFRFAASNREWRDVLGKNARRAVLDRYSWTHHVSAILHALG